MCLSLSMDWLSYGVMHGELSGIFRMSMVGAAIKVYFH